MLKPTDKLRFEPVDRGLYRGALRRMIYHLESEVSDPNADTTFVQGWLDELRDIEADAANAAAVVSSFGKDQDLVVAYLTPVRLARLDDDSTPHFLGGVGDHRQHAWWFRGKFWVGDESLEQDDVMALATEHELDRERRLSRARAVSVMSGDAPVVASRAPIPRSVRMFVWQRDCGRCVECQSNENLEFDHIIPLAMGGSNTERNLQLLCGPCNRTKGATLG